LTQVGSWERQGTKLVFRARAKKMADFPIQELRYFVLLHLYKSETNNTYTV